MRPLNVLLLCTGNTARSILAEAILNHTGNGIFRAFSAGSIPKGQVNPHALNFLRALGHDATEFRSKSWDEFAGTCAPQMACVTTRPRKSVQCGRAQPMTAH